MFVSRVAGTDRLGGVRPNVQFQELVDVAERHVSNVLDEGMNGRSDFRIY